MLGYQLSASTEPIGAVPPQQPLQLADLRLEHGNEITPRVLGHCRVVVTGMRGLLRDRRKRGDAEEIRDRGEHGRRRGEQLFALERDRLFPGKVAPESLELLRIEAAVDVGEALRLFQRHRSYPLRLRPERVEKRQGVALILARHVPL